ncbi:MAG: HU family DNA-binding protein [Rickettsia sp.]|nr:HU family DNA-binding protein [Rickettsia sp.]
MHKEDFIKHLSEEEQIPQKEAAHVLNMVLNGIESALIKTKELSFIGFGKFDIRAMSSRIGRNPKTGEEIKIPAYNKLGFRPGVKLQNAAKKHK